MPTLKPRKGCRKGWATQDQRNWLEAGIPAYVALKVGGQHRLNAFWLQMFDTWFERWPEEYDNRDTQKTVCINCSIKAQANRLPTVAYQTVV